MLARTLLLSITPSSLFLTASIRLASSMSSTTTTRAVIDSHLHVWAAASSETKTYPYTQDPPPQLQDAASIDALINSMNSEGVKGALIVQPINHKFDHSYVQSALQRYPDRFKGMLLYDPSVQQQPDLAVTRLEELALQGFVGVRFNPYLWPSPASSSSSSSSGSSGGTASSSRVSSSMCDPAGMAVYQRCAELHMPVGIMCFQGLKLHYTDICTFLQASPDTPMILDHFGFTGLDDAAAFDQLLSLAAYPAVHVKISALFRLGDTTPDYEKVYSERFLPLLKAFGKDRLLFGSDFPFCLEQPLAYRFHNLIETWCERQPDDGEAVRAAIMSGTAEKLFGSWGGGSTANQS